MRQRWSTVVTPLVSLHGAGGARPSFPTRRSSDLARGRRRDCCACGDGRGRSPCVLRDGHRLDLGDPRRRFHRFDCRENRKSTRLNSSHPSSSYAVFCLKKTTAIRTTSTTSAVSPCVLSNAPALVDCRYSACFTPRRRRCSTLFPYTTLFRSCPWPSPRLLRLRRWPRPKPLRAPRRAPPRSRRPSAPVPPLRLPRESEEHTSELQSPVQLVCRLLLEKNNRDSDNLYHIRCFAMRVEQCASVGRLSLLRLFHSTAPAVLDPLSLHDALPILPVAVAETSAPAAMAAAEALACSETGTASISATLGAGSTASIAARIGRAHV